MHLELLASVNIGFAFDSFFKCRIVYGTGSKYRYKVKIIN